jgi:general secretion pathway protein H
MQMLDSLNSKASPRGFTLVEVLVLLLIISIVFGLTIARLPIPGGADAMTELRRFERLFSMARNEARLGGKEYGLGPFENTYEFMVYDDEKASWVEAKRPWHRRVLPGSLTAKIELKNEERGYKTNLSDFPPVLILSSGEVTPFQFRVASASGAQELSVFVDGYGNIVEDEEN